MFVVFQLGISLFRICDVSADRLCEAEAETHSGEEEKGVDAPRNAEAGWKTAGEAEAGDGVGG